MFFLSCLPALVFSIVFLVAHAVSPGPYHRITLDSPVQAKQSMEAQLEDELALRQGQIVKITHIIDKDWFR